MPVAAAIGASAVIGGAVAAHGQHSAQKSQERASDQAIGLAKEQEAQRRREWEAQKTAAEYQWKVNQANLAPYRAARASILSKYGINTNVDAPPMPEGYGMPGFVAPPTNPRSTGDFGGPGIGMEMLGAGALGLGSLANSPAFRNYLQSRGGPEVDPRTGRIGGGVGLSPKGPGYQFSPLIPQEMAGPPTNQIIPGNVPNWSDWQQYLNAQPYYQGGE